MTAEADLGMQMTEPKWEAASEVELVLLPFPLFQVEMELPPFRVDLLLYLLVVLYWEMESVYIRTKVRKHRSLRIASPFSTKLPRIATR